VAVEILAAGTLVVAAEAVVTAVVAGTDAR
jgi:hypothetical protein